MDGEIVINLRQEKRFLWFTIVKYKPQGFLFGTEVWLRYWEMQERGEVDKTNEIPVIYFLAADNYQKERRLLTDFTIEDVRDWIKRGMLQDQADAIAQCMMDSKIVGKKVSEFIFSDDSKKK